MRLDPISGDGTGASLRSAILACAMLEYLAEGREHAAALDHYRARVGLAFRSHLSACERLYTEARLGLSWNEEIANIRQAIAAARAIFPGEDALRFELRDYALSRV